MKTGIALSGGGDKGAFTVGALNALIDRGETFDMIAGTSTGALIAPLLAIKAMKPLNAVYGNVNKSDILSNKPLYAGLITGTGFYGVGPLREIVEKTITESMYQRIMDSKVEIFICTVCLSNMQPIYWTNSETKSTSSNYDIYYWRNREEMIDAIMASCCQPVLMPNQYIHDEPYVDGGLRNFLPIDILIDNDADKITAILTTTGKRYYDSKKFKTIDTLMKTIEIFSRDVAEQDLKWAEFYNQQARAIQNAIERLVQQGVRQEIAAGIFSAFPGNYKRIINLEVIRPYKELGDGLTFDSDAMKQMIQLGYQSVNL